MTKQILKLLRIKHYIKNLTVFVPLIFSMNFTNIEFAIRAALMFLSFCAIASAVYIINDILDKDSDKTHPIKSLRPIASGFVSVRQAYGLIILLTALSLFVSFNLNFTSALMVICYLLLNIIYSLFLKNIAITDVSCIAIGFILRILCGCFVICVIPSPLVILMTFFLSMFFSFSKRKLELKLINDEKLRRKVLKGFTPELLNQFVSICAVLSIAFYITYTLDEATITRIGNPYLYLSTIPLTLIIFRLLFITETVNDADDPLTLIEDDSTVKILFAIFVIFVIILIFYP